MCRTPNFLYGELVFVSVIYLMDYMRTFFKLELCGPKVSGEDIRKVRMRSSCEGRSEFGSVDRNVLREVRCDG